MSGFARNYCIARGSAPANAGTVVYRVPVGYNLILKSMGFWVPAGVPDTVNAVLLPPDGLNGVVVYNATLSTSEPNLWSNWVVLNEQDALHLNVASSPVSYWISGALLLRGAPVPVASSLPSPLQGQPPHVGPPPPAPQRISIV